MSPHSSGPVVTVTGVHVTPGPHHSDTRHHMATCWQGAPGHACSRPARIWVGPHIWRHPNDEVPFRVHGRLGIPATST
eukprot:3596633-Prorocentrum_lima.AAC.1